MRKTNTFLGVYMLKRMCTLFLAFAFATTASAATIGQQSVREAINDFNYSVQVEWDQQDQAFYKAQVQKLEATIAQLRADGMSNAEIVKAAAANVQDAQLAKEINNALSMVNGNMSAEDAQKAVMQAVKANGNHGASWSGSTTLILGVVLVGLILAASLAGGGAAGSCYDCGGGYYYYDPFYDPWYYDPWYGYGW